MGGMENIYAGITGAAESTKDIMKMIIQERMAQHRKSQDLMAEQTMWEKRLPMETEAKLRIERERPSLVRTGFDINGNPIYETMTGGKLYSPPLQNQQVSVKTPEQLHAIAIKGGTVPRGTIRSGLPIPLKGISAQAQEKSDFGRTGIELIKNYYQRLRAYQGKENIGMRESLKLGAAGYAAKLPIVGRTFAPELSDLDAFRQSQGAALAKLSGDRGNIALTEQENALKILAPPGTKDLNKAEATALTRYLEGITGKTPQEEQELLAAKRLLKIKPETIESKQGLGSFWGFGQKTIREPALQIKSKQKRRDPLGILGQ